MHPYSLPIRQAVAIIQRGGLIAYPTEGVFGLGCNLFDGAAVARLLALKQRPLHKGLILISDRVERFEPFLAPLTDAHWQRMCSRWPGPMTWTVPHNGTLPEWITGGRSTVAIRVTAHPVAANLCAQFGQPLVSTSANRQGRPALERQLQVRQQLANELDFILPGRVLTPGKASQIEDLISGQRYRA
jgi:L-threonylcarbamoyladenylate synthase